MKYNFFTFQRHMEQELGDVLNEHRDAGLLKSEAEVEAYAAGFQRGVAMASAAIKLHAAVEFDYSGGGGK